MAKLVKAIKRNMKNIFLRKKIALTVSNKRVVLQHTYIFNSRMRAESEGNKNFLKRLTWLCNLDKFYVMSKCTNELNWFNNVKM